MILRRREIMKFTGRSRVKRILPLVVRLSGSVNFTYANIIDRVDNLAPVITVGLVSDTGSSGSDKVTSNPNLTVRVSDTSQIVEFKAGWINCHGRINLIPDRKH
jgi:hypothetical protein